MCKVSIIIPVYNEEKYLTACLESLAAQSLKDIEIIVVNNCSTDDSLPIAKKYAKTHSNFKIVSVEKRELVMQEILVQRCQMEITWHLLMAMMR